MILRTSLAAGLFLAALPAAAANVAATHVPVATPSGKLAYVAYRPIARADCAAKVMHTVPAGKINHWVGLQNARCQAEAAATKVVVAHD